MSSSFSNQRAGDSPLTETQVSAGGVVFRQTPSEPSVCLILRNAHGRDLWCLPKGHIEKGESDEEAATREVREETGILAQIESPLRAIRYSFFDQDSKKRIMKTVHFFLMNYRGGSLDDHDNEVKRAEWVPVSKVLAQMCYPSEREVVALAIKEWAG